MSNFYLSSSEIAKLKSPDISISLSNFDTLKVNGDLYYCIILEGKITLYRVEKSPSESNSISKHAWEVMVGIGV